MTFSSTFKSVAMAAAMGVALSASMATSALAEDLEFMLINLSPADINGFYVSPASSGNWQENLLDGAYLPAGNEVGVWIADGLTTCISDLRVEFADGDVLEDFGLDLCELGSYTYE